MRLLLLVAGGFLCGIFGGIVNTYLLHASSVVGLFCGMALALCWVAVVRRVA